MRFLLITAISIVQIQYIDFPLQDFYPLFVYCEKLWQSQLVLARSTTCSILPWLYLQEVLQEVPVQFLGCLNVSSVNCHVSNSQGEMLVVSDPVCRRLGQLFEAIFRSLRSVCGRGSAVSLSQHNCSFLKPFN